MQPTSREEEESRIQNTMNIWAFLPLILLPTCHSQSNLDCPEEDIKKMAKTNDFLLTGNETVVSFSKRGETKLGTLIFTVKCMEKEKFWIRISQENTEVKLISTKTSATYETFFINDPGQMTFIHLGDNLSISILDEENTPRTLVKGAPLSPDHRNCTLHAQTSNHYVVWFPCQHSESQQKPSDGGHQAKRWYLLFLPVLLALSILLFLCREKLM